MSVNRYKHGAARTALAARVVLAFVLAAGAAWPFGVYAGSFALLVGVGIVALGWLEGAIESQPGSGVAIPALIAGEIALVAWALFAGVPFARHVPLAMVFLSPALMVLLCLLALHAMAMRPTAIWWSGGSILAAWLIARAIVVADPFTITKDRINDDDYPTLMSYLTAINGPHYFNTDVWVFQIAAVAGCVIVLGIAAHRLRRLSRSAADADATRAALAAHFSATVVEEMLKAGQNRFSGEGDITVIDCDLVGFSAIAATQSPGETARLLKAYHSLVEDEVFAAAGAVLKFTGDGVSAVFGLSRPTAESAADAVNCARKLVAGWPHAASKLGLSKIPRLAVGVETGDASWGVVGAGRAMSLVVLGAAIDSAARLQAQTRVENTPLLLGRGAMEAAAMRDAHSVADLVVARTAPSAMRLAS